MRTNLLQSSNHIAAESATQLYNQLKNTKKDLPNTLEITHFVKEEPAIYSVNFSQEMLQKLINNGHSKQIIAKELRTSVTTINRILQGDIINPRPQIFSRLLGLYCLKYYS